MTDVEVIQLEKPGTPEKLSYPEHTYLVERPTFWFLAYALSFLSCLPVVAEWPWPGTVLMVICAFVCTNGIIWSRRQQNLNMWGWKHK